MQDVYKPFTKIFAAHILCAALRYSWVVFQRA
jgi:hypothetical protein